MTLDTTGLQDGIHALLVANLPAVLTAFSLPNFDQYLIDMQGLSTGSECNVMLGDTMESTDELKIQIILRFQILPIYRLSKYTDAVHKFFKQSLRARTFGYLLDDPIDFAPFPLDTKTNLQFLYFSLNYRQSLDDCDQ